MGRTIAGMPDPTHIDTPEFDMNIATKGAAKRLIISLIAMATLGGCAVYGPPQEYGAYPASPYGQNYYNQGYYDQGYYGQRSYYGGRPVYGPPVYYGPEIDLGIGFGFGGHHGGHGHH
jgi:hypothetical protein